MKKISLSITKIASLVILSTFATLSNAKQTVLLQVKGIEDPQVMKNVRIYLSTLDNDEADGSQRYKYLVTEVIDKALRAVGYFDSQIEYELIPRPEPQKDRLIATVKLNSPVKIAAANVQIVGAAKDNVEFQQGLPELPAQGSVLNQKEYDDYKSALQKNALSLGYFDANFSVQRLEVYPDEAKAYWNLVFNSGERYKYANIHFHGAQIREDYLRNILTIQTGQAYSLKDLSNVTNAYSNSNWFSSVLVQPELKENHLLDVNLLMQPRKKNSYEIGIGYASDVGPRLQFGWKKPWINDRGHSFSANLYLSRPKQTAEMSYRIPVKQNPLNYYYEIAGGMENEQQNDTRSLASTFSALRYWNKTSGWQVFTGLRGRYDSFRQGDISDKTLLLYPTLGINRTRLRGGLFPEWGDSQRITFDLGRKIWRSDVDFFKVVASTAWVRTYFTNHRFYLRGEAGYLQTSNFAKIPPALRFFAGGDRSVRGYGYHKISPKDDNGDLSGGRYLATATAEYQYQFLPNWWGATFYDTGLATNKFKRDDLKQGIGVGVRWSSPVGAIKFDVATPVKDQNKSKNVQFYIGLGMEL